MPRTRKSTIRILGIDPGLQVTGYGVIDVRGEVCERDLPRRQAGVPCRGSLPTGQAGNRGKPQLEATLEPRSEAAVVEAGFLQTDRADPLADRLARLHEELTAVLSELKPDLAAVEKLYAHYRHPRTAILMGHARGAILLACAQAGVRVRDFPATMIKRALTGNGHASKQQVQHAVRIVCRLRELPEPPDVADALAIALCAGKQVHELHELHEFSKRGAKRKR